MKTFLLTLVLVSFQAMAQFPLATGGSSDAYIVTMPTPTSGISTAAVQLAEHILLTTGATVPLKTTSDDLSGHPLILVGNSSITQALGYSTNDFELEQFRIQATSSNLVLLGRETGYGLGHEQGTMLAVYTFLRDYLGCRWFWPGPLGRVIQTNNTIAIQPTNFLKKPAYLYRKSRTGIGTLPISQTQQLEWMWRNRLEGRSSDFGHSFGDVVTVDYEATNPEYFAFKADLVNRWMHSTVPDPNNVSLDLSNHVALVPLFAAAASNHWALSVANATFPVVPPDSLGTYRCRCNWCTALFDYGSPTIDDKMTESRYSHWFANEVARAVQPYWTNRYIVCLAYAHYRWPSTNVVYETNFIIAPTFNRFGFGYQIGDAMVDISKWTNMQNTVVLQENYYSGVLVDSTRDWDGAPRLCPRRLDIETKMSYPWVRGNVMDIYTSTNSTMSMWMLDNLNLWIKAELEFDPLLDVEVLIDEYCDSLYGPASAVMKEYYELLERRWTVMPAIMGITYYQEPSQLWDNDLPLALSKCWNVVYPPAVIQKLDGLLQQAKAMSSGVYLDRLNLFETSGQDYMEMRSAEGRRQAAGEYGPRITTVKITIGQ